MNIFDVARQFESSRSWVDVCEVVVREVLIRVFVFTTQSGGSGSMLIDVTTKTSRSKGDKFKSTLPCVNVLAADSTTAKPIAIELEVDFNPDTMDYW